MTSRRAMLAGLGTVGVAGLAGCSALPFGDDGGDRDEDVSLSADAFEPVTWPESPFPVAVPTSLANAHRERARGLLEAVPADPAVPNAAIAADLREEREQAADRLAEDVDEPWPTDVVSQWRNRLREVATVRGAYRAATGESEAGTVAERRQSVRANLGSFVADHQYRAASPLEAVLAHEPVERLIAVCRRRTRPNPAYPADPLDRPFRAGEAVGRVELARATLDDARGLREAYLAERSDTAPRWRALLDASDRLGIAVSRTRSTVSGFLDVDEPPFDADLEGTAARTLFTEASRRVASTAEAFESRLDDGDYAAATITAGRTLAAVEALRAAIDGIRNDAYQEAVTAESVHRTARRALEALAAVEESEDRRLAAHLARPALETVEYVPETVEMGYGDPARIQGELARAELYARAVPAATSFVVERLG